MGIELIDGHRGAAHITANQIGICNDAMYGISEAVEGETKQVGYFDIGSCFKHEIVNNNLIRVHDGLGIIDGRRFVIEEGDYEDLEIENGRQDYKRIDTIVVRYEFNPDTRVESAAIIVKKGTEVSSSGTPVQPALINGNIRKGDIEAEYLLGLVKLNGLTIEDCTMSASQRIGYAELMDQIKNAIRQVDAIALTANDAKKVAAAANDTAASALGKVSAWNLVKEFTPVLYAYDGVNDKYAGGYVVRKATSRIIAKRCYLDVWLQLNNIGTLGTGDLALRIKGTASNDL